MLDTLFNKHGCDKSSRHKYHLVYERDFSNIQNERINILEIGIFKGNSIKAWLEYFPNAHIYGIDIFTRINPEEIGVLNNDRVHWIRGDSLSDSVVEQVNEAWPNITFDVIIDDGKHTPEANRLSFKNLSQFLNKNGSYYIEDVWPLDIMTETEMKHQWIQRHQEDYSVEKMSKFLQEIKGWNVERIDLRAQAKPDSYIIKIRGR